MTLFTLLLAAFRVLLARYGGQDDVLISSPVTLRDDAGTRRMVGCLVNNVGVSHLRPPAIRVHRAARARARDAARRARAPRGAVRPRDRGAGPGARSPASSRCRRSCSSSTPRRRRGSAADVTFGIAPVQADRQSYWDLEWSLTDHGDGQRPDGSRLLCDGGVRGLARSRRCPGISRRCSRASRRPRGAGCRSCRCSTRAERHRVLVEWNATAADYPRDATLHELVAAAMPAHAGGRGAARRTTAIVTYAELEAARAAAARRSLRALGAAPGERVALSLPPSRRSRRRAARDPAHRCGLSCRSIPLIRARGSSSCCAIPARGCSSRSGGRRRT